MAKHVLLLLVGVGVSSLLLAAGAAPSTVTLANATSETPTAYEMLGQYNFPRGILPEGVQGYELGPDNSSVEVHLPDDCQFKYGDYLIHYSSRVHCNIRVGSISALEGVKVKVVLVWLRVWQVDRDGDQLRFRFGRITKSFPVSTFSASPHCD